jgi:hypothetical protein
VVEDSLDDSYFVERYYGAGRLPAWAGQPDIEATAADNGRTPDKSEDTDDGQNSTDSDN